MYTFYLSDLYIHEFTGKLDTGAEKKHVSWNERRIILSIITFGTLFWNPTDLPTPLFIYTGTEIPTEMLCSLFPKWRWICYFTRARKGTVHGKDVTVMRSRLSIEECQKWRLGSDEVVTGALDIQTSAGFGSNILLFSDNINMNENLMLLHEIKPRLASCLFIPKESEGSTFEWNRGILFWEAWARSSLNFRLVIRDLETKLWSSTELVAWSNYHNTITRGETHWLNPITFRSDALWPPELINDFDSTYEILILKRYLERCGVMDGIDTAVIALSMRLNRELGGTIAERRKVGVEEETVQEIVDITAKRVV